MIITIHSQATSEERAQLMAHLCRISGSQRPITTTRVGEREVIALEASQIDSQTQSILSQQPAVERLIPIKTPYQLVSRAFQSENTSIVVGEAHDCEPVTLGGTTASPVIMAGPCAIENREQLLTTAREVKEAGAQILRGGAFKPRTSPYQFQGLGIEGLHLLAEAREITGLPIVTEVMEPGLVPLVAKYADVLQIGARNMQNYALLHAAGESQHTVLLKRGMMSTMEELPMAAEYILSHNNHRVMLCERGIRTFETYTRNTFDINAIPVLKAKTHLPIIADPSHAVGRWEYVPAAAKAAVAAGADGLIMEVHCNPEEALSDGAQSLRPERFASLVGELRRIAEAVDRTL